MKRGTPKTTYVENDILRYEVDSWNKEIKRQVNEALKQIKYYREQEMKKVKIQKNKTTNTDSYVKWPDLSYTSFYEIEYDFEKNCRTEGCIGICCRCKRITNETITHVDVNELYSLLLKKNRHISPIKQYCLYRLLICCKAYNPDNWYIKTCRGYYGEEIVGLDWNDRSLPHKYEDMMNLETDRECLEYTLILEYGHILPELDTSNIRYSIIEIDKSQIWVGVEEYRRKLKLEDLEHIEEYPNNLPIGLYLKQNDQYRIIDGYHRYVALAKENNNLILCADNT